MAKNLIAMGHFDCSDSHYEGMFEMIDPKGTQLELMVTSSKKDATVQAGVIIASGVGDKQGKTYTIGTEGQTFNLPTDCSLAQVSIVQGASLPSTFLVIRVLE